MGRLAGELQEDQGDRLALPTRILLGLLGEDVSVTPKEIDDYFQDDSKASEKLVLAAYQHDPDRNVIYGPYLKKIFTSSLFEQLNPLTKMGLWKARRYVVLIHDFNPHSLEKNDRYYRKFVKKQLNKKSIEEMPSRIRAELKAELINFKLELASRSSDENSISQNDINKQPAPIVRGEVLQNASLYSPDYFSTALMGVGVVAFLVSTAVTSVLFFVPLTTVCVLILSGSLVFSLTIGVGTIGLALLDRFHLLPLESFSQSSPSFVQPQVSVQPQLPGMIQEKKEEASVLSLPTELVHHIFQYLDFDDLRIAGRVSRAWARLAADEHYWLPVINAYFNHWSQVDQIRSADLIEMYQQHFFNFGNVISFILKKDFKEINSEVVNEFDELLDSYKIEALDLFHFIVKAHDKFKLQNAVKLIRFLLNIEFTRFEENCENGMSYHRFGMILGKCHSFLRMEVSPKFSKEFYTQIDDLMNVFKILPHTKELKPAHDVHLVQFERTMLVTETAG